MMICSVLPSIRLRQAAVVNVSSNAVANTLPAGGALAMGVSWAMLSSWGVGTAEYVLYTLVSGIWNVFTRLGLPVTALLVLATAVRPGAGPARGWRITATTVAANLTLWLVLLACLRGGAVVPRGHLPAPDPSRRARLPGVAVHARACARRARPDRGGQPTGMSPLDADLACSGRGLAKRQCSVMAALEIAAQPHHTEANPETVSLAMMMTATRLTTPKIATFR